MVTAEDRKIAGAYGCSYILEQSFFGKIKKDGATRKNYFSKKILKNFIFS